jgi:hypothetical protein
MRVNGSMMTNNMAKVKWNIIQVKYKKGNGKWAYSSFKRIIQMDQLFLRPNP